MARTETLRLKHPDIWHIIQLFKHKIIANYLKSIGNYCDILLTDLIDFLYLIAHTKTFYVK